MKKNPYINGDEQSRNDLWTTIEGFIDEIVTDDDETIQYYYVRTIYNDRILCKQLSQLAGEDYGIKLSYHIGDKVLVGYVDSNPNNNVYILGACQDKKRKMKFMPDIKKYTKKITDIFMTTPEGESLCLYIQEFFNLQTTNDINIKTDEDFNLDSKNISLTSTEDIGLTANKIEEISNTSYELSAPTEVKITSNLVKLGGDGAIFGVITELSIDPFTMSPHKQGSVIVKAL